MNIYFIPGLAANSKVFKNISLPEKFKQKYIEWLIPNKEDTIAEYAKKMAVTIDKEQPFILVGYSFGGIIVQEMSRFLNPEKIIIISSIKDKAEIPKYFKWVRTLHLLDILPISFFSKTKKYSYHYWREFVIRKIYKGKFKNIDIEEYLGCLDPIYLKWSMKQIIQWKPPSINWRDNNYFLHIHGTQDIVFPSKYIINPIFLEGDHLILLQKPKKINEILRKFLHV